MTAARALDLLARVLVEPAAGRPPASADALARLAGLAYHEQVLLPLADWFESAPAVPDEVRERLAEVRDHSAVLRAQEQVVHEALRTARVPHVFLKGYGLEALRPGHERQMSDLDMVVPDAAAGWAMVEPLVAAGYQLTAMSVCLSRCGPPGGAGALVFDHENGSAVEASFGDFHPHWYTCLPLPPEFFASADPSTGAPYPSTRWTAAIFLAEMVDRPRPKVRDRLDAELLFARLTAEDVGWLRRFAARHGLVGEAALVEVACPGLAAPRAARLHRRVRRWAPTATRMIGHDFAGVRRRAGAAVAARSAVGATARDLLARLVGAGREGRAVRAATNWLNAREVAFSVRHGGCMALVPLDAEPAGELRMAPVDGEHLVASPVGVFLATALAMVDEERYERALRAVPRLGSAREVDGSGTAAPHA